jgi:aminoglycoside N3'-acetyltransferase
MGANTTRAQRELVDDLINLGVTPGGVLVVHTAFSKVGPVEGGPLGLVAALRDVLGERGTLVMPSMSDDDDRPFDVSGTECAGMGIVANSFWRLPGVLRSDSPHAFAAIGPHAPSITVPHPDDIPHGLDSPVGRVWALDGQVLLLGVGHDANTTIHLAENMAGVGYGQAKSLTVWSGGTAARVNYFEIDHCCERFAQMDEWLEAAGRQRRGRVGNAEARLSRSHDIVDAALRHLAQDETVFLHPPGVCDECDRARAASRA